MINMAKSIIRTNKDDRCSGLVDKVDSINFITQKSEIYFIRYLRAELKIL